jgi:hypothetical protein
MTHDREWGERSDPREGLHPALAGVEFSGMLDGAPRPFQRRPSGPPRGGGEGRYGHI